MQKLSKRTIKSNTPNNTSQVVGSVSLSLNKKRSSGSSEQRSKTLDNVSDENLTPTRQGGQNLRVSVVYVWNRRGKPLMPCSPREARVLLKGGKAKVVRRKPFTIQLTESTGETKQDVTLGVDSGYKHIGLSAKTEKKEIFSAEVILRDDIVNLLSEKRSYRRNRRGRKAWYRKARFLNRGIPAGWLAPSIQHKLDSHIKVIKLICSILSVSKIVLETANFDIQKIKNPEIEGEEYQEGEQKDFWNVREYVLFRDNHICQICKKKNLILNVHHIISRKTGGDRPENLITLCKTCHSLYHKGNVKLKVKITSGFKAETFMTMVRKRMLEDTKELGIEVKETFGYITKMNRMRNKIEKSHVNDAFVISGGTNQIRCVSYFIKQIRKQNRKLFKGKRSEIKNTERIIKGFNRFDKVEYNGIGCFVFGRRATGYFDIRRLDGEIISKSVNYKKLRLLEKFRTLLWEDANSSTAVKNRVVSLA